MNLKGERVASEFRKEITDIILNESRDEDFKFVTITYVKVTNDLSFAKVYFTTLNEENKDKVGKDLNNAAGFFRTELANRLNLRHTPELKFVYDESIDYAKNIEKIIQEINE